MSRECWSTGVLGRMLAEAMEPFMERPMVSELCSAAMLLPCAATCPSVVASVGASAAVQL